MRKQAFIATFQFHKFSLMFGNAWVDLIALKFSVAFNF